MTAAQLPAVLHTDKDRLHCGGSVGQRIKREMTANGGRGSLNLLDTS